MLTQPYIEAVVAGGLAVGLEYQYWSNKAGIEDFNESLPQLMIKHSF